MAKQMDVSVMDRLKRKLASPKRASPTPNKGGGHSRVTPADFDAPAPAPDSEAWASEDAVEAVKPAAGWGSASRARGEEYVVEEVKG